MRKSTKTLLAVALGCSAILTGCKSGTGNSSKTNSDDNNQSENQVIAVTGISLDASTKTINVGGTFKLNATIAPENASNKGVSWSSSNTAIAMVDSNGNVVGMSDGTAVITGASKADGSYTAFCVVTVGSGQIVHVNSVSLNKSSATIKVGATEQLNATVLPSNATNKAVSWSSDNPSVATVGTDGKVSAVAVGSAKITVTTADGNKTAECQVTVNTSGATQDEEEYTIKCNAPSGVTATLSKNKAKEGEEITLGLAYEAGYAFKSIKASGATLTTVTEGISYKFTMGDRPVTIDVEATVSGEVVVNGEINAVFAEETKDSGLFIARNVAVPSAKSRYGFNVVVNGVNVKAIMMDEALCDGDIQSGSGSYQFSVGAGSTYDFFFDSTRSDYQFYARRVSVELLPNNTQTLESIFKGGRMHSQSALHPQGLSSIHYEKKSAKETYDYDYKIFNDGTAFGHTVMKNDPENPVDYYTWKSLDSKNNLFKVMTTWPKELGNNESSDDLWRIDPHNNGTSYGKPYAATFDIISDNSIESSNQHQILARDANRTLNSSAHYGAALEYEIYESYRGDFTGAAVIGAANAAGSRIDVSSVATAEGFKTTVASQLEWNRAADSYEDGAHEAIVYSNIMNFNTKGDLLSMDYSETYYSQTQWDFTNHEPLSGAVGSRTTIKVTNGYDAPSAPALGTFDPSAYFIKSIDKLCLYNEGTKMSFDENLSYLKYNDLIQLIPVGNGGKNSAIVHDFEFSPSTALDGWQYKVSSVEDSNVVTNNHQGIPMICGTGESDITFTNKCANDPAKVSKTIRVKGVASGTVNGFYVHCFKPGYDSYDPDNGHANKLNGTAGKTCRYYIDASNNTGAPIAYSIIFKTKNQYGDWEYKETNDYCIVEQTGQILVLNFDTPAANALTSSVVLTLKLMSEFYKDGFGPTELELTIQPNTGSVVGTTWTAARSDTGLDYATVTFSGDSADASGYRTGEIKDFYYNGTSVVATDTFTFKYSIDNNNKILASITDVDIESNALYTDDDDKAPTVASDYDIYFSTTVGDGKLGVVISFYSAVYGDDESDTYGFILGEGSYDDESYIEITGWYAFTKVSA